MIFVSRFFETLTQNAAAFLNVVIPSTCPICKTLTDESPALCAACWKTLHFVSPPFCRSCAYPLEISDVPMPLCGKCAMNPLDLDATRTALVYDHYSKFLIMRYKHGNDLYLASIFTKWLQQFGEDLIQNADLIVPVPLHPRRLFKRGYNQAAILSNRLSHLTGIPTNPCLLERTHHTPSQGHLTPKARQENLKGAFAVSKKYTASIKGQRILLVDDVMTTGTTLNECAKALKKGGATEVTALVLARAIL